MVVKVIRVIKVVKVFKDEGEGESWTIFFVGRAATGFFCGWGNKWIYWYVFFTNAVS